MLSGVALHPVVPTLAPTGMNPLQSTVEFITAQQDFLWFCVALAWVAAGSLVFVHRANPEFRPYRRWLQIVCASGLLLAAGEMVLHSLPEEIYFVETPDWDLALSGLQAVQTFAAILLLAQDTALGRRGALLFGGAVALLWAARPYHFVACAALLWLAGVMLGWMLRKREGWSLLIWVLALIPLVATTGLAAELAGVSRRWVELSHFAIPASLSQFAAAVLAVRLLGQNFGWVPRAARRAPMPSELRLFIKVIAVWLGFGLVLAVWIGRKAARAFEDSLLSRVQVAALLIDPAHVSAVLGPRFRLDAPDRITHPGGRTSRIFHVPGMIEDARALRLDLTRVQQINPDIYWAQFLTFRDGYFVAAVLPQHLPAKKDVVVGLREISADDQAAWDARPAFFERPYLTDYGEMVQARAPLVSPKGEMLGWLGFEVGAVRWAAAQAIARLQTFALLGLGVVLALFVVLQRLAQQERERIELAAGHALEADRAKTAFLAKVSHELRTPVQSILGYGELLGRQSLGEESQRWLGSVHSQGQLLIRLVNDLIDLSALQSGAFRTSPHPADLVELVRSTVDSLKPRAVVKQLDLRAEVGAGVPRWMAFDPERVRQVLLNLVSNGLKFTSIGGVVVRLERTGLAADGRHLIEISVRDTGPGIAAEDMARLFRPFTRLQQHDRVEGAGLGLALSAGICQSMHGDLRAESDGASGTTFIVRLPLAEAAAPKQDELPPVVAGLAGLRVLVADDNALVREFFVTSLRQAGAWVDAAADGLEAVELCAHQEFAVVVLDLSMPWLNGFEAARRIRAASPRPLRLVGVSAHAGATERALASAAGMDVVLVKPVAMSQLLAAVAGSRFESAGPGNATPADLGLLRRLREQFRDEAPRIAAELTQALAASDRGWLRARAHYLKNSADVAGFPEVSLLCAELEQRATDFAADPTPVATELLRLLVPPPLSPDASSGIKSEP